MKLWPFPLIRNKATNPDLDAIFCAYLEQDDLEVTAVTQYRAAVKCRLGTLEFWIANRLYAYAQEGKVENLEGDEFRWGDSMPGRWACREMDKIVRPIQLAALQTNVELFTRRPE